MKAHNPQNILHVIRKINYIFYTPVAFLVAKISLFVPPSLLLISRTPDSADPALYFAMALRRGRRAQNIAKVILSVPTSFCCLWARNCVELWRPERSQGRPKTTNLDPVGDQEDQTLPKVISKCSQTLHSW